MAKGSEIKMARFCGLIGYAEETETAPGVWEKTITERRYYGDVTRNTRKLEGNDKVNSDLAVNNAISIMGDPFAYEHFFEMVYAEWQGARWKITNVEVQRPRLLLTLGGLYNGNTYSVP